MDKTAYFTQVFQAFKEKHPRATEYFLRIYAVSEDYIVQKYLVNTVRGDVKYRYMPWYWLKKTIKMIERRNYFRKPPQECGKEERERLNRIISSQILNKRVVDK